MNRAERDPFEHAQRIGRQLGAWAVASVAFGGALAAAAALGALPETWDRVALGIGVQCLVWGAIDGAIAWFGQRDLQRRRAAGEPDDPAATRAFARRLRRLLLLNAGLDVLYVAVGVALITLWQTPDGLGHGIGVVLQGGFLLVFDTVHGTRAATGDGPRASARP